MELLKITSISTSYPQYGLKEIKNKNFRSQIRSNLNEEEKFDKNTSSKKMLNKFAINRFHENGEDLVSCMETRRIRTSGQKVDDKTQDHRNSREIECVTKLKSSSLHNNRSIINYFSLFESNRYKKTKNSDQQYTIAVKGVELQKIGTKSTTSTSELPSSGNTYLQLKKTNEKKTEIQRILNLRKLRNQQIKRNGQSRESLSLLRSSCLLVSPKVKDKTRHKLNSSSFEKSAEQDLKIVRLDSKLKSNEERTVDDIDLIKTKENYFKSCVSSPITKVVIRKQDDQKNKAQPLDIIKTKPKEDHQLQKAFVYCGSSAKTSKYFSRFVNKHKNDKRNCWITNEKEKMFTSTTLVNLSNKNVKNKSLLAQHSNLRVPNKLVEQKTAKVKQTDIFLSQPSTFLNSKVLPLKDYSSSIKNVLFDQNYSKTPKLKDSFDNILPKLSFRKNNKDICEGKPSLNSNNKLKPGKHHQVKINVRNQELEDGKHLIKPIIEKVQLKYTALSPRSVSAPLNEQINYCDELKTKLILKWLESYNK